MNIVVTGAGRGIGKATAAALCYNKIDNLVLISRNLENLIQLKSECDAINSQVKIQTVAFDLLELFQNKQLLLEKIKLDRIDILINNAGSLINKPFLEIDVSEAENIFKINLLAPALLVRMLYKLLNNSPRSHVINIGSMGGFQGSSKFPGLSYYSASKSALANITECLAEEFSNTNIKFNCLALGAVNTEMLSEAFPGYSAPVNAIDIGKFIADFALNGHKFFNGKIIPVSLSTP